MTIWELPWVELAVGVPLAGALWVSAIRDPSRAFRWGLLFTGAALGCALLAWIGYRVAPAEMESAWSVQPHLFGRRILVIDRLSAPLLPVVALLHFLTALATART